MFCSISGQTPEEPVVSKKSGHVFERRLIEKFVETNAKCPVTGEVLSLDDLMPLKTNKAVKPRPVTATSIPGMLALFQNEWDSLMLETYTLKQHLDQVRQELAHALYQHDAACRVIARLVKERDAARSALATLEAQGGVSQSAASPEMEVEEKKEGIPSEVIARMEETSAALSKQRKKRPVSPSLATPDQVASYAPKSSAKPLSGSILALDVHPSDSNLVLVGGSDGEAALFNKESEQVVTTLRGHTKRISGVLLHPSKPLAVTCSADQTSRVWSYSDSGDSRCVHTIKAHSGEVVGCSLHATGDYLATASADNTWSFVDLLTGSVLSTVRQSGMSDSVGYTSVAFHPDGLILGTGTTDGLVRIWDAKSQTNVATFEGNKGLITSLAFSENGYYMATTSQDNTVKLWDLRKLANFKTLEHPNPSATFNAVKFDYSGNYLAAASSDVRVFVVKTWSEACVLSDNTSEVAAVGFGKDASYLASGALDGTLKFSGF